MAKLMVHSSLLRRAQHQRQLARFVITDVAEHIKALPFNARRFLPPRLNNSRSTASSD